MSDTKELIEVLGRPWAEPANDADNEVQRLYRLCQRAAATIARLEAALESAERVCDAYADENQRISDERDAARREAMDECARLCENARPAGGRMWTDEQAACFDALSHVAAAIRAAMPVQAGAAEITIQPSAWPYGVFRHWHDKGTGKRWTTWHAMPWREESELPDPPAPCAELVAETPAADIRAAMEKP